MSLALVQSYESEDEAQLQPQISADSEDEDEEEGQARTGHQQQVVVPFSGGGMDSLAAAIAPRGEGPIVSALPSAVHVFSEVTGPPEFLRPAALAPIPSRRPTSSAVPTGGPVAAGAVIESRAQLVGGGGGRGLEANDSLASTSGPADAASEAREGTRTVGAGMPPKEDAANLLSACESCQVPKTFSAAEGGMVCPLCLDRGEQGGKTEGGKKRTFVKDKEKNKRMKGQSSHATWKSETEMHLRQTYD